MEDDGIGPELLVAGDLNVKLPELEGDQRGGGGRGSANYRRAGGYVGPLPPTTDLMVSVREDMELEHCPGGEGSGVPDVLHPSDGLLSILESFSPGHQA